MCLLRGSEETEEGVDFFFTYIFSTSVEENACSDLQNLVDSK